MPSRDGGPAFPHPASGSEYPHGDGVVPGTEGMSLRDYFAAHALQGLVIAAKRDVVSVGTALPGVARELVARAYAMADAMLIAREGHQGDGN